MDYEKKYKEALERARQFSEHPLQEDSSNIVEYIFPELAESKDEKIRKELSFFLKEAGYNHNLLTKTPYDDFKRWADWFEKQGEQKPIEWSGRIGSKHAEGKLKELIEKRIEQKPVEWSEEDVRKLNTLIGYIVSKNELGLNYADWLKSLRPQKHWRPTEEQISALEWQLNNTYNDSWQYKATKELLEQLKQL